MASGLRQSRDRSGAAFAVMTTGSLSFPVIASRSSTNCSSEYAAMAEPPLGLDGRIGVAGPLGPRAVVHRDLLVADHVQSKRQHRGRDALAARRHDGLAEVHPGGDEGLAKRSVERRVGKEC